MKGRNKVGKEGEREREGGEKWGGRTWRVGVAV